MNRTVGEVSSRWSSGHCSSSRWSSGHSRSDGSGGCLEKPAKLETPETPTRHRSKVSLIALFIASLLLLPGVCRGQGDPGPAPGSLDTPPQMMCLGSSLKAMRADVLEPHFAARHAITALHFGQMLSINGSDVYLGSIRIEGAPLPLALDSLPFLPTSSVVRWGYVHINNSAPPDEWLDTFVMAQTPVVSGRVPRTVIGSSAELDLVLQVCDWMQEGLTPPELMPMRQWLEQPDTRIEQLRSWRQGKRVHLLLSGRQQVNAGTDIPWRTEISWQPTAAGGFLDLEVLP